MHKTKGTLLYEIVTSDYLHPETNLLRVRQDVKVTNCADTGLVLKRLLGELLDLLSSDGVDGLADLVDLVGLAALDKTSTSELHSGLSGLAVLELLELGESLGLGKVLVADTAGDSLDGVDDGLSVLGNVVGRAGESDAEETGVGEDVALGLDLEARGSLGGLEKTARAGRPLDAGGTTKQRSQNGSLGLVRRAGRAARAGESNDHRVAGAVRDTLLTTEVLGLLRLELVRRLARDVGEELADPLVELALRNTVADNGEGGLGVGGSGEVGDRLGVDVLADGEGRRSVDRLAETAVESKTEGGVLGHCGGVGEERLLVELHDGVDLLVENVGCAPLAATKYANPD